MSETPPLQLDICPDRNIAYNMVSLIQLKKGFYTLHNSCVSCLYLEGIVDERGVGELDQCEYNWEYPVCLQKYFLIFDEK